jgi:hypothetical protein
MMEQNKKEKNEKIIFGDWLVLIGDTSSENWSND